MPVRGFKRPNSRQGVKQPNLPRPNVTSNRVAGAPTIPRAKIPRVEPYPALLPTWPNSLGEWIVYAYLTQRKKFKEQRDFFFQVALPAPGLNGKDFNRADFWLPASGANGAPDGFFPRGVVLNPISPFTHPSKAKDKIERLILGNAGFREIFIEGADLEQRPARVIEDGLRGRDDSSRGSG